MKDGSLGDVYSCLKDNNQDQSIDRNQVTFKD